jgi:hypothetical protein
MKTPRLHHADARLLLPTLQAAVALPIIAIGANTRLAITATAAAITIHAIRPPRTTIAAGALLTAIALLTIIAPAPIQPPARPSSGLPSTSTRPFTSRPALSAAASSVSRAPACATGRDLRLNVVQRAPFPSLAPGSGGPPAPERSQDALERHLATGRKAAVEGGLLDPTNRSIGEHFFSGVA